MDHGAGMGAAGVLLARMVPAVTKVSNATWGLFFVAREGEDRWVPDRPVRGLGVSSQAFVPAHAVWPLTHRKLLLRGSGPVATPVEGMMGRGFLGLRALRLSLSRQLLTPASHLLAPPWPDAL